MGSYRREMVMERMKGAGKRAILFLVLLIFGLLLAPLAAADDDLTIEPVPQTTEKAGDAVLVGSGGSWLLMDSFTELERQGLISFLLERTGGGKLSLYLSHYHADHYGNLVALINHPKFKIGRLYLPDPGYIKKARNAAPEMQKIWSAYQSIVKAAKNKKVRIIYLREGSSYKLGRAKLKVLFGPFRSGLSSTHAGRLNYVNDASLVTRISASGVTYLTCGDLSRAGERALLNAGIRLRADVLKLNHHGTAPNSNAFLAAVRPSRLFYQSDASSARQKPAKLRDVIKRASVYGKVYNTRIDGRVCFKVNGGKLRTVVRSAGKKSTASSSG